MKQEQASSGTPSSRLPSSAPPRAPLHLRLSRGPKPPIPRRLFARAEALGVWHVLDEAMTQTELPALLNGLDAFIARCDHLYLTIDLDKSCRRR